jgi:sulfotransferase
MNKQYFFLSGMFRSGNTVLASILNQNSNLYVSPLSPLVEYMWNCHNENFEESFTFPNKNNKKNMISKMIENFYEDINKPIIIDRNKTWANPSNIEMIKKYINNNPKIIFTIRPLEERIVSMINILKNNLLLDMKNNNFVYDDNISENDNIAEYLLNGNVYNLEYFAYSSYVKEENDKNIHLVKYEDLLKNPTDVLKNIYNFLEIDSFTHDFNNIKILEKELDAEVNLPEKMHKINSTLKNNNLIVSDFLSEKMIKKCREMNLFYK